MEPARATGRVEAGAAGSLPLVIVHRAGNDLACLRAAEAAGFAVEADVRLFHGRLELRHAKSLGPLPVFWDLWELAPWWRPRLVLDDLIAAARPATTLMLHLKGAGRRVGERVAETLRPHAGTRRFVVSARLPRLLEPLESIEVERLRSVHTARELRKVLAGNAGASLDGVCVHERLVTGDIVRDLRRLGLRVVAWAVDDPRRASQLVGLEVDGLVTGRPDAISICRSHRVADS